MHTSFRTLMLASLASAAVFAPDSILMAQPVQNWQAKAPGKAPPPPPPPPAAPAFVFDADLEIPRRAFGGGDGGAKSVLAQKLEAVPVGKSFIETVTVAETITDPAARLADFKAQCKTVSNRVSGAVRRFRKDEANANKNFAVRTVSDEKLGYGIRVWREADTVKV